MTWTLRLSFLFLFGFLPSIAGALDLALPNGAQLTVERATAPDSFDAPIAPFDGAIVPVRSFEGAVTRRAWRVPVAGLTPLQVMVPLREQLEAQGYDIVFECASQTCGGFDFRFAVEVLPGPNMYVNISSYRYLTAFKGSSEGPERAVTVLVSVTSAASYIQIVLTDTLADVGSLNTQPTASPPEEQNNSALENPVNGGVAVIKDRLLEDGYMVLSDLEFGTGTSELGPGPYPTLERLATLLRTRADLRIALVGHTDTVGGLDPNIALSRDRARAVRQRLIEAYGVVEGRLDAEGMGYLSPVASNLTPEGRERNRRVEAVLLNISN